MVFNIMQNPVLNISSMFSKLLKRNQEFDGSLDFIKITVTVTVRTTLGGR